MSQRGNSYGQFPLIGYAFGTGKMSLETDSAIDRLKKVALGVAGTAAAAAFLNANSTFFPLVLRLVHLNLERIDYAYLAIYFMLIFHGGLWFHFGHKENDYLLAWLKPTGWVTIHTGIHTAFIITVGVLFAFLFWCVTDFFAFTTIYTLYVLVDVLQFQQKKKDLKLVLLQYSSEIGCKDPFSGNRSADQESAPANKNDLRCSAIEALHEFHFVRPIVTLHLFLLGVSFFLASMAAYRIAPQERLVVVGYVSLLLAFGIHEAILWRWRNKMFSTLEGLRRQETASQNNP